MSRYLFAFLAAALLLASCSSAGEQDATRDDSGEVAENEDIGVFRLRQGDCLIMPSAGIAGEEVETLEAIPCSEPHDGEVLSIVTVAGDDDAPFPGDALISAEAETGCLSDFQSITGVDFALDTEWDMTFLSPTTDSWTLGNDREIVCIVLPLDGQLTTATVNS
ncbi:MAG: septum formation family protein [Actinomycetota bacterium]